MTEHRESDQPSRLGSLLGLIAAVALLGGLVVWKWLTFGAPFGGDWAQYMSHARALVEGRPYGQIGYLFSPASWLIGPPIYPPGLALLLGPSILVFGESTLVPRLLMHVLLGVFVWSAYRYFSREDPVGGGGGGELAFAMAALLGTGFLLGDTANVVSADLGMCALVWLTLVVADRDERWSGRVALLLAALGTLAILFRIAALPLVPTVGLWALLRWRRGGVAPWIVGVVWAATLAWVLTVFGPGGQATQAFNAAPVPADLADPDGSARFLFRLGGRLGTYRLALSEAYLYPFRFRTANHVYHLVAVPLTAVGLWGWFRPRRTGFGTLFAAMTVGMLMTLPVWTGRYAWVLTPFACYGLARGIAWAWRLMGGRPALATRCAAGACITIAILAAANAPPRPRIQADADDWRAMGEYLTRDSLTGSLRVASNRPRVLTWYTRIPAMGLPLSALDVFLSEAHRLEVTRVVVTTQPYDEDAFRRWEKWRSEYPELFRLLHVEGQVQAYEIVRLEP